VNDRRLLELAATAAGYNFEWTWKSDSEEVLHAWINSACCVEWNPLADDGDALRLAADLMISVTVGPCQVSAASIGGALLGHFPKEETIHQHTGPAIRRAIVRAVAGKAGDET
jgi:hypothetical protein